MTPAMKSKSIPIVLSSSNLSFVKARINGLDGDVMPQKGYWRGVFWQGLGEGWEVSLFEQVKFAGARHSLGAVADTQFGAQIADVLLNSFRGYRQLFSNLAVGQTRSEML